MKETFLFINVENLYFFFVETDSLNRKFNRTDLELDFWIKI